MSQPTTRHTVQFGPLAARSVGSRRAPSARCIRFLGKCAAFCWVLAPLSAAAQQAGPAAASDAPPSRAQCIDAHRNAQELKLSGKLLEARNEVAICSSAGCPGPLIIDCGGWISELEQNTPSLVFEVTLDGKPVTDAKVFVDDQPVTDFAQALKLNPGRHTVRAELPSFEPQLQDLVLAEGMRARVITIAFRSPEPAPVPSTAPAREPAGPAPLSQPAPQRPTPVLVYPLLGVGAAGLATFGVFSLIGKAKQSDLEKTCEPECTDDDLSPMKTAYLVGDISAGVGAASLIVAGVLYFTRPAEKVGATPPPRVAVVPIGKNPLQASALSVVVTQAW